MRRRKRRRRGRRRGRRRRRRRRRRKRRRRRRSIQCMYLRAIDWLKPNEPGDVGWGGTTGLAVDRNGGPICHPNRSRIDSEERSNCTLCVGERKIESAKITLP